MPYTKKIMIALLLVCIGIQFIQPERNQNEQVLPTDLSMVFSVPVSVLHILQTSCYDCHSNKTHYPWYASFQPGAWWMALHIRQGKSNLNFSEFGAYSNRKQQGKLQAIANSIKDQTMPLWSYNLLHTNAKLSPDEKVGLLDWVKTTKDSLSLKN